MSTNSSRGYTAEKRMRPGLARSTAVRPSHEHDQERQLVDRPNPRADNQAVEMASTVNVAGIEVSEETFDGPGWATAMRRRRHKTPPSEEPVAGTVAANCQPKAPGGPKTANGHCTEWRPLPGCPVYPKTRSG
ncbi:hypothetical protein HPB50_013037 [Hyalomma asiaticum]|uniref:Uncharacterized protein n=1 Tax=Hyalomma asiaticum TaxID=266040 RepID=A0ACB7S2V3_HYAAI|nr:hypothetical protein HPB50_013037 [Hyalomma asiaticum]